MSQETRRRELQKGGKRLREMNECSGTFVPFFYLREILLSSSNNLPAKQIGLNASVRLQDAALLQ